MEEVGFEPVFLTTVATASQSRLKPSMCLPNLKLGVFSRWVLS